MVVATSIFDVLLDGEKGGGLESRDVIAKLFYFLTTEKVRHGTKADDGKMCLVVSYDYKWLGAVGIWGKVK